ncbi:hypothetical protein C8A03DRAFT_40553 [Achaetomium macrosporum]|uniref:Defect at low temperature protein 1 n=1 Tax=Achaetomium macrosporum TaxID=79813 RepID=A0AAN7HGL8_9PEZI|nr:hypothetical protein C8A03DRAFT_40553 [Achaetomium macrosporum]
MSAASLLFSIVYNVLYYFLYLILFAFIVVTPIDVILQAVRTRRNYDILVITVCYVATILVVAFIYATRLYISRSVLASIPKQWVPIEKGDVPRDVRQMIVEGLGRSAAIAYEARPRVPLVLIGQEPRAGSGGARHETLNAGARQSSPARCRKSVASDEGTGIGILQHKAIWGEIEHPGWSSPTSPDLPDLQYDTVVQELPNLIEAKALTLAPPDPESRAVPPELDPDAIALLQRPGSMGLREYLMHLTNLAVLAPLPTTGEFLAQYEAARFSARPLSNEQFRNLMRLFAEILRNMHPLSPAALARYEDGGSSSRESSESDIDNDAPRGTSSSSLGTSGDLQLQRGNDDTEGARRDSSSTASSRHLRPGLGLRNSSANTWQYRTAPTTLKSRRTGLSRASSSESFAHTRRPYPASQSSSASVRSVESGSVIRLAGSGDATDLPYVLTYSPSQ